MSREDNFRAVPVFSVFLSNCRPLDQGGRMNEDPYIRNTSLIAIIKPFINFCYKSLLGKFVVMEYAHAMLPIENNDVR